jgi:hypothetical protein
MKQSKFVSKNEDILVKMYDQRNEDQRYQQHKLMNREKKRRNPIVMNDSSGMLFYFQSHYLS